MRVFANLAILFFAALGAAQAAESIPNGQLPRWAQPLHYALHFTLDPQQDGFDGETVIRIRLHQPSGHLWLHGRDLTVSAVTWRAGNDSGSAQYRQLNGEGVARVDFGRELPAQDIELTLRYSAAYNKTLDGIYKVTRGPDSYLATQFEAIAARKAFPGFDEPSFKTPFDVTLTVPESLIAIANTRQTGEERGAPGGAAAGQKTLRFASTEPLPTYLIALGVGNWDVSATATIAANEVRATPLALRVFGPRGSKPKLDYALATTPAILAELERYFGVAYPFDKLDLLAAPDFAFGAMENAGLITFRELILLVDAASPVNAIKSYYSTNAHELAHQWFGDHVTLAWWDDIWLNEAFATWMAHKIVHRLKPEFRNDLALRGSVLGAMDNDSLASARRIREPIIDNGDINSAFDSITYQKGGGVLAMFESWLGEDTFAEGIRLFMRKHGRGNATSDDLIVALSQANNDSSGRGETLALAMKSFLDQPGIPLIRTRLNCNSATPEKSTITLSQSRYLPLGSQGKQGARWKIPVCLKLGEKDASRTQCMLLEQPEQSFELASCPDWYLPNAQGAGYYRYLMPKSDLAKLNAQFAQLSAAEQMIHADAISAGFHRGDLGADAVLDALPQLAASPLPQVASFLFEDFNWMIERIASPAQAQLLRRYAAGLYQPRLEQLGYVTQPGESQDATLLRGSLARFLALDLAHAPARQGLLAPVAALWPKTDAEALALERGDANLLGTQLAVLVQERGEPVLRRLMAELQINRDPQQRLAMLSALGAVDDPRLAPLARDFILAGGLQMREMGVLMSAHTGQAQNRAGFWEWMQPNFERVMKPYPLFAQSGAIRQATSGMCSAQESAQIQQFFTPRLDAISGGKRAYTQSQEQVQLCTALRKRHGVKRWVQQRPKT